MRGRRRIGLGAAAACAAALAAPRARAEAPVVGGHDAAPGAWPDAVAVLVGGQLHCGGVLVAPDLVVTAGHCCGLPGSSLDPPPDHVLVGAPRLSQPGAGETLAVARAIAHADIATDLDVGVLVLAQPSTRAPRTLATGWGAAELHDGAAVTIVGWGATMPGATAGADAQQEATTTIVDAACASVALGCRPGLEPGGELRAGGGGVDACNGDSGGPLYVGSPAGALLAATTYAGYSDGSPCGAGGIYERADRVIGWLEATTGETLPRLPAPSAPPLAAVDGGDATSAITVNDPAGGAHTFAIAIAPVHGAAEVDATGVVTFHATGGAGDDTVVIAIHDAATPARQLDLAIPITVAPGGCGCAAGDARGGALPVLVGLLAWRRRRRARPPRG